MVTVVAFMVILGIFVAGVAVELYRWLRRHQGDGTERTYE